MVIGTYPDKRIAIANELLFYDVSRCRGNGRRLVKKHSALLLIASGRGRAARDPRDLRAQARVVMRHLR